MVDEWTEMNCVGHNRLKNTNYKRMSTPTTVNTKSPAEEITQHSPRGSPRVATHSWRYSNHYIQRDGYCWSTQNVVYV